MVEESEALEAENVMDYMEKLRLSLSPSITVEYLHGKMKAKAKNEIMERLGLVRLHQLWGQVGRGEIYL